MSNAVPTSSTCTASILADEAAQIICQLQTCDLAAAVDRLLEIETNVADCIARTREGALFQLAVVNAHVDLILSHVPEHSEALPRLEQIYGEVQRLLFSVSKLLSAESTEVTGSEIGGYYFSNDPFVH